MRGYYKGADSLGNACIPRAETPSKANDANLVAISPPFRASGDSSDSVMALRSASPLPASHRLLFRFQLIWFKVFQLLHWQSQTYLPAAGASIACQRLDAVRGLRISQHHAEDIVGQWQAQQHLATWLQLLIS